MSDDVEKCLTFIRDKAKEKSEARASRVYLEQFRKSQKALLKIEARKAGVKTDCEAEDFAYSHPDYLEVLEGLKVATERDEYLALQIEAAKLRIATWQTKSADARAERRAYG